MNPNYTDIFGRLDYNNRRIRALSSTVRDLTTELNQVRTDNPPYFEVVWRVIASAWSTLSYANADMNSNFTSMVTLGNTQRFYGGSGITLTIGTSVLVTYADIISINDIGGVVTSTSAGFSGCTNLQYINLPKAQLINPNGKTFRFCAALRYVNLPSTTFIGNECFNTCTSLETLNINKCTTMDSTTVFDNIVGQTITVTLPAALVTDPNIITLQTNNTVTIITV